MKTASATLKGFEVMRRIRRGVLNFFVVVPEIVASLFLGFIVIHFLHNNRMLAVVAGGVCMLIAALMQHVRTHKR